MIYKLFAIFLIFSVTSVQASTDIHRGLKKAFDELEYSLVVNWDQKNMEFYTNSLNEFYHSIGELKGQGLKDSDLIEFMKAEVKDKNAAQDFEQVFALMQIEKMSVEESQKHLLDIMNKSYQVGGSWDGGYVLFSVAFTAALFGVAGYFAIKHLRAQGCDIGFMYCDSYETCAFGCRE